jgi:hypothetical protein
MLRVAGRKPSHALATRPPNSSNLFRELFSIVSRREPLSTFARV